MLTILAWIPRIARFVQMFQGVAGAIGPFVPWLGQMLGRIRGGVRLSHSSMVRG